MKEPRIVKLERYRFGVFEFDAATLELRREGRLVRLPVQPARVVAFLVQHADQVVSREELRKAVWSEDTHVDFDAGLNFCMSQIRSALHDNAEQPVYIRTIPKRGYQFIAPVQRLKLPERRVPSTGDQSQWRFSARASVVAGVLVATAVAFWGYHLAAVRAAKQPPIVAVVRFDSEVADPAAASFTDALTDNVVTELGARSGSTFRVIGNARILRLPREQRDLTAIASELHAGYAVLGQVQKNDGRVRVLAHLIRLSDQTHIWVVRIDSTLADPLALEAEAAGKIATEFSAKMADNPSLAPSFGPLSH